MHYIIWLRVCTCAVLMIQGLTLVPGPGAEQCLQIHGIRSARKSDTFIHPALWTGSGWSRNFFPDPRIRQEGRSQINYILFQILGLQIQANTARSQQVYRRSKSV